MQAGVRRIQSFGQTARAVDWLRDIGIESINLDLMYGLPQQTVSTVIANAQRALALEPDRIALFGYAHVPWMKRHQRLISPSTLPGSSDRFAQSRAAADVSPIGLDHFASAKVGDRRDENDNRIWHFGDRNPGRRAMCKMQPVPFNIETGAV